MFEREIKILDVDVQEAEKRIQGIGAEFVFKTKQKIYTYDLPTISHRLAEAIEMLAATKNPLLINAYRNKLKTILLEAEDLLPDSEVAPVVSEYSVNSLPDIVDRIDDIGVFERLPIVVQIRKLLINPNKWVRLRDTNGHVTLTVKHIFDKNTDAVQKVGEYEIEVSSVAEADSLLGALGLSKRNAQEKIRTQYRFKSAEIDIEQWPRLSPYIEIESDDMNLYREIIDNCGFNDKEIVSCNTEELYKRIGINSREIPELLFE